MVTLSARRWSPALSSPNLCRLQRQPVKVTLYLTVTSAVKLALP